MARISPLTQLRLGLGHSLAKPAQPSPPGRGGMDTGSIIPLLGERVWRLGEAAGRALAGAG